MARAEGGLGLRLGQELRVERAEDGLGLRVARAEGGLGLRVARAEGG